MEARATRGAAAGWAPAPGTPRHPGWCSQPGSKGSTKILGPEGSPNSASLLPPAAALLFPSCPWRVPAALGGGTRTAPGCAPPAVAPLAASSTGHDPAAGTGGGSLRVLEAKTAPRALPRAAEHPPSVLSLEQVAATSRPRSQSVLGEGGLSVRLRGAPCKKKTKTTKTNPKWHAEKQTKKENKRKPEAANGLTCANYVRARWGAGEGRAGGKLRSVQRERGRKQKEAARGAPGGRGGGLPGEMRAIKPPPPGTLQLLPAASGGGHVSGTAWSPGSP